MTAQIRIRTRDMFTDVSETRPDEDGFAVSWKTYGPFATAGEQRAFMRGLYESIPGIAEEVLTHALATIDTWVRFDEEEGYQAPTPELPEAPPSSGSSIMVPSADEVRRYTPSDARGEDAATAVGFRAFLDGLRKRVVW